MGFLPSFGQYLIPFLVVLSVVVFVHEFGHYWVARRNGVKVETFSIGFGPELFGRNDRHGTRWKFSAIPLGGYVKMLGDADATSATADQVTAQHPDSFPAKSVRQRMAIVFAGPAANMIYAVLAFAILFATVGRPFTPPEVGEVTADSAAAAAGLQPGDRFLSVDGVTIESFEQLQGVVSTNPETALPVTVERDGTQLDLTVTPALQEVTDRFGNVHRIGRIGVSRGGVEFRRSNPFSAVYEAAVETGNITVATLQSLWQVITGARDSGELGGPLRIAQMTGEVAKDGWVNLLWFSAVLSINLGLINLFPIPMLDGGHLVLYALEAIRGRPLPERTQEIAFRFGVAAVLSLMVFATWNDLVHLKIFEFFARLIS